MTYLFDGFNYILRFNRGEDLRSELTNFLIEQDIQGGWLSGIGATTWAEIGYYDGEIKDYQWKVFDQPMEIVGIRGTASLDKDGQPMFHAHATFAQRDFTVIGGHLKTLVVGATCEMLLHRTYKPLKRSQNDDVQLQTLDL